MTRSRCAIAALAATALLLISVSIRGQGGQGTDYVTEEEEDLIRDAQGLNLRVPLLIKFLDNRIVALGLR